ncbi:hypothetical protein CPB85DRAFT_635263 [Mucidula mucida]|nr:hypothetical protein CPB85DRAFT_635263 [Mucidula mucida]
MELKFIPRHKLRHLAESQCIFCIPLQLHVQQTPLTIIKMKMHLQLWVPKLPRPQNLLLQLVPVVSGVREASPSPDELRVAYEDVDFRYVSWKLLDVGRTLRDPERMIRTMVRWVCFLRWRGALTLALLRIVPLTPTEDSFRAELQFRSFCERDGNLKAAR